MATAHPQLTKGYYPSREKLNDEINSEPRIYEKSEDIQRVIIDEHIARNRAIRQKMESSQNYHHFGSDIVPYSSNQQSYQRQFTRQQRACYNSAPRLLTNKRISYAASLGSDDNHLTDYGFAPWQSARKAESITGNASTRQKAPVLSLPKNQEKPTLSWHANTLTRSSDNITIEILHV